MARVQKRVSEKHADQILRSQRLPSQNTVFLFGKYYLCLIYS
jgi:hypothetical protein